MKKNDTGAVIVAAGMSSRMGDFKPMLKIGNISVAQRIIATLKQSGVDTIIMVTGYNADLLERHLADNNIVFLRNERYEKTQMFESACIGLEYIYQKCSRILFTPVDIPLFTSSTVEALLDSGTRLACPVCGDQTGHPILISSELVPRLLRDSGKGGLRAALSRTGETMEHISVEDEGVLHDADTPADFERLLEYHNRQLARPVVSISLSREKIFFDEKTAMLFHKIEETGSVRRACRLLKISYSKGWDVIRNLESQMDSCLITRTQGGCDSNRSQLTADGKRFLRLYDQFSSGVKKNAMRLFRQLYKNEL